MKIQNKVIGIVVAFAICFGFVSAQNLGSLINNLGSVSFGYSNGSKISIKSLSGNKVTIESPLIKDQAGANIVSYTTMYSQHPLSEILEQTNLLNETKESAFQLTNATNPFTMDITIDNLDATKKYYFFVIPKDSANNLGELSNEVWVNFANKSFGNAGEETTIIPSEVHSAADDTDISLMHISHTLNGNQITLTWSDIDISKNVEIDVMKPGSSLFEDKVSVSMSDEKYVYTAGKDGSYVFRFHAIDCGKQINYTVNNVSGIGTPETPTKPTGTVTKVPKTGATENILAIVILAGLLYLGYTKLYKRTK